MSILVSQVPTIESIDAEIADGFRALLFQADLERRYEHDMTRQHKHHLFVASMIGLVLYDMFLINDWSMIHDVFWTAVIFRIGIFTPIAAVGMFIIRGTFSLKASETLAGLVAVLAVGLVMGLYSISDSIYRPVYQYGPLMIMIFTVVVQRIRVRYCLPTVAAMLGVQTIAAMYSTSIDAVTFQAVCTICATVSILVVFAAYGFEHERRRSYLLSIRGQLMNDQLDHYGKIDPLTGLWNRRHLNAMMKTAWANAAGVPQTMAVILLDIDHFKLFNDTYGHLEGDVCLKRISLCVRKALDHYGDVVVRFGGEEFLIFIAGTDSLSAEKAAHLLRQAIHYEAIPYAALGDGQVVTASIGVATGLAPEVSATVLMRGADVALYRAKHGGRDRIETLKIDNGDNERCRSSVAQRAVA